MRLYALTENAFLKRQSAPPIALQDCLISFLQQD